MQESNTQKLKLQLKNCQLESCSMLNEPLLEVLGVAKSKATVGLQQLLKHGFKTWEDVRSLKSPEMTVEAIGGDEANGRALWRGIWDYENRLAATKAGHGTIPFAEVKHAFAEDEKFWSNENELEFVLPSQFEDISTTIKWSMEARQRRSLHYVACEGLIGGGRTRCGKELVLEAAASSSKISWKRGYVSAGFLPQFTEEDEQDMENSDSLACRFQKCFFIFAWALCCAFGIPPVELVNYTFDWTMVIKKLREDFKLTKVSVLLLVDDSHLNPNAARMIAEACTNLWNEKTFNVVPIFAGSVSMTMKQSRLTHYAIESLPLDKLSTSFARRIGIEDSVLERCPYLQNLVMECNGHPGLLELLAANILRLDDSSLARLRQEGILDVAHAKDLYQELLNFIKERYSLSEWSYALFGKEMIEPTREIVTKLLLDALVNAHVRHADPVVRSYRQVTYKYVERTGLICLEPREDGQRRMGGVAQVALPALAITVMNQEVNLLDEKVFKIFTNPIIEYGFQNHEQLAMANLQARIMRRMKDPQYKYPNNTFFYEDLRDFAFATESEAFRRSWVNIEVPETYKVLEVRQLFHGEKVDLRPVNNNPIESCVDESAIILKMAESINDTSMDVEGMNESRFIIENNDSMNDSRKALKLSSDCSELVNESDESFQEDDEEKCQEGSVLEEAGNERLQEERGNVSFQKIKASSDSTTKIDPIVLQKTIENDCSLLQTISEEASPEPLKDERVVQAVAGTSLIASVDNQAIDGASLFRGIMKKRSNQPCWVLVLSLSEWSHPVDTHGVPLPTINAQKSQSIRDAIEKLSNKKDEIIRAWLGEKVKDPVVVVYDIFTDCISESDLVEEDLGLNEDDLCAYLVTTADNVQRIVEPGFAVRARMKWILN